VTSYGVDWAAIDRCVGQSVTTTVHPGELLRDWLAEHELSQRDFGLLIPIHEGEISRLCNGKRDVGPALAIQLERETGVRAEVWLHLQMSYDLGKLRAWP
jgi:addiction module HigA family antidote